MLLSNKACPEAHPGFLLFLLITLPVRALVGVWMLMLVPTVNLAFAILLGFNVVFFGEAFQEPSWLGWDELVWIFGFIAFADDSATLICRYDLFHDGKRHWVYPASWA